ncbi:hypothetical protein [Burkholderia ambifaria]|uniref:hypothetical protein n=1 Tax=Burkholderia ambifaria TaxID=152480 RepID=UPI002FE15453
MTTSHDTIYMLYAGDGRFLSGPYVGQPSLNIDSLADQFRAERYTQAEGAGDDYCWISEDDFPKWLVQRGLLAPLETVQADAVVDTSGDNRYVPKHWPTCPSCGQGKGDKEMGRVLHELNRADWHRKCTECGHTWDHHDRAYYFDQPMLEDDGRCVESGCVPYALSQAGALPIDQVLEVCRECGWIEGNGIESDSGLEAARRLGIELTPCRNERVAGTLTLRRLFDQLSPAKSYIVAVRGHWLAFVRGENRDQSDTHLRSEVIECWEVRQAVN